jgi:hypothetical protein
MPSCPMSGRVAFPARAPRPDLPTERPVTSERPRRRGVGRAGEPRRSAPPSLGRTDRGQPGVRDSAVVTRARSAKASDRPPRCRKRATEMCRVRHGATAPGGRENAARIVTGWRRSRYVVCTLDRVNCLKADRDADEHHRTRTAATARVGPAPGLGPPHSARTAAPRDPRDVRAPRRRGSPLREPTPI